MLKTSTSWDQQGRVVLQTARCSPQDSCNIYSTRTNAEGLHHLISNPFVPMGIGQKSILVKEVLFTFHFTMQKK